MGSLRPITVAVSADRRMLSPQKALAVGLIVNELVTNAFKYAFPEDKPGLVSVGFRNRDTQCELTVTDNGVGCGDFPEGVGSRLVSILAAQLGGSVKRATADPGTKIIVTFAP